MFTINIIVGHYFGASILMSFYYCLMTRKFKTVIKNKFFFI